MKRIFAVFLVLVLCLSLTACDVTFLSSESLMRPPKLSGESSLLQKAFEDSVIDIESVIMKTPISGQNRSSYLFYDLDKDGKQEGFVFYSKPVEDLCAYVSVFKSIDGEWRNISTIKGKSEEIYEVNFSDINGDNVSEIFLSWTGMSVTDNDNSYDFGTGNERVLTVYGCDDKTTTLLKTEKYSNLFLYDLNNDSCDEIVLFLINLVESEKRTTARILSFNNDYSVNLDETLTLTGFLEINNIITDTVDINDEKHTRIFIDGSVSEQGILTEIIDISENTFDITLPLYEQNNSVNPKTLRASRVNCRDIDNDGVVEIPTIELLPYGARISKNESDRKELYLTVWSEFINYDIQVDFKCLMNSTFGYLFKFSEDGIENLTAVYDDNDFTLTFYLCDLDGKYVNKLFSIKTFLEPEWGKNSFEYSKLSENSTYVYGVLIFDDETKDELKDYISENFYVLNQE